MLETDRMKHLDLVETAAKTVGFETRRENYRSLQVVQIKEANGQWCTFDPILNGKDVAKFLWQGARCLGLHDNEMEFRKQLLKEMMGHDYTVSKER